MITARPRTAASEIARARGHAPRHRQHDPDDQSGFDGLTQDNDKGAGHEVFNASGMLLRGLRAWHGREALPILA